MDYIVDVKPTIKIYYFNDFLIFNKKKYESILKYHFNKYSEPHLVKIVKKQKVKKLLKKNIKNKQKSNKKLYYFCSDFRLFLLNFFYFINDIYIKFSKNKQPIQNEKKKNKLLDACFYLRVSTMISNSPYILVLDCDMYCNDSSSARQAMCFHLDPKMSPSLAFVQFPQKFHNISKNDIYNCRIRSLFTNENLYYSLIKKIYVQGLYDYEIIIEILWKGMDGLEGPCLSGTCFYINRNVLYGSLMKEDVDIMKSKQYFGSSKDFIKSLGRHYKPNHSDFLNAMLFKETQILASCAYENQTKWGKEANLLFIFEILLNYETIIKFKTQMKGWSCSTDYTDDFTYDFILMIFLLPFLELHNC
ncbi:hypothetical protein HYC85_012711 [Camellia sinensis]|uniref:Uncharacterized protein n=1 Tax=Camellia sinensis TaxID=4442 RepID=A0A7J7HFM5_CAMSI|nr:hypothetical protein HYC85_012711 [Camellia sinensis]